MYLTQANAKLWFGILALLAGGCGSNGECDFAPERCVQREVHLNVNTMERSIGGELNVSFDGEHRQSGNLIVELLPLKDGVVVDDSAQELINVTPPVNMVTMKIESNTLNTGSYQVRVRQNAHELTITEKRPVLKVTETQIMWQPSDPLAFAAPTNIWFGKACKQMPGIMDLSGVWVGRPPVAPTTQAEIIMSRDYTDCQGKPKTQFLSANNPPSNAFNSFFYDAPSSLDLWQPTAATTQVIEAIRNNSAGYQLTSTVLQNPQSPMSFGDVDNITFEHVAIAGSAESPTMLVTIDGSFHGYMLQSDALPMKIPVDMGPFIKTKIVSIVGYTNSSPESTSLRGAGFLLMDDHGIPYLLRIDGGNIVYDSASSASLQKSMRNENIAPIAIAASDINGDGLTDLAVLRSNKTVSFYLQLMNGDLYSAASMTLSSSIKEPAAIAIGQVDGQGYSDLLIGDRQPQACGQTLCNMVHVFLNASTVVQ